jgi:hypothetical protein
MDVIGGVRDGIQAAYRFTFTEQFQFVPSNQWRCTVAPPAVADQQADANSLPFETFDEVALLWSQPA